MQRNYWSDTFKQYLLKYFIFDSHGNLIDFDRRKRRKQPIDKDGYKTIKIKGKYYKVHHILYFLYHGKRQEKVIDHIDGNKLNNCYNNLRVVDQAENCRNIHIRNKDTNCIGISYDRNSPKLLARYTTRVNGKQYRFRKLDDAIQLRKENNLPV